MEFRAFLAFAIIFTSSATYAEKSSAASPRTLWLDTVEDSDEAGDKKDLFRQVQIKEQVDYVKPISTPKLPVQQEEIIKDIPDERREVHQDFKRREGHQSDKHGLGDYQQEIAKVDSLQSYDISQIRTGIYQEISNELLKKYCTSSLQEDDYKLCVLLCNLKPPSDENTAEFPSVSSLPKKAVTRITLNPRGPSQSEYEGHGGKVDAFKKDDNAKLENIPETHGSKTKLPPSYKRGLPAIRKPFVFRRSKRWSQALSDLIQNCQISGVSFSTTGPAAYYVDPHSIIRGIANANGLTYEKVDGIAWVVDCDAESRNAVIGSRSDSGYTGEVVVYF